MISRDPDGLPEKWRIGRAALYGLVAGVLTVLVINLSDGGAELARSAQEPIFGLLPHVVGYLVGGPVAFAGIAALRNFLRTGEI